MYVQVWPHKLLKLELERAGESVGRATVKRKALVMEKAKVKSATVSGVRTEQQHSVR